MLLGFFYFILLFFFTFGSIYVIEQGVAKDELWGLLLALVCVPLAVFFFYMAATRVDVFYALIVATATIMRFGMEQVESRKPASMRAEQHNPLKQFLLFSVLKHAEDNIEHMPQDSVLRRLLTYKISDTFVGQGWQGLITRLSKRIRWVRRMTEALPEVAADASRSEGAMFFYRGCGVLLMLACLGKIAYVATGREAAVEFRKNVQEVFDREVLCTWACGRTIGHYAAERFPERKVLLISRRTTPATDRAHERFIAGLIEGFQNKLEMIGFESVPLPEAPATDPDGGGVRMVRKQDYFTALAFDHAVDSRPDCGVVISDAGLPDDVADMKFWQKREAERPKLIVVNASLAGLKQVIKQGFITAAVINHPGEGYQEQPDRVADHSSIFEQAYLLIDADNVDRVAEQFPEVFAVPEVRTGSQSVLP